MLRVEELKSMRETMNGSLPDTGAILTRISTSDGRGRAVEIWSQTSTVLCRVQQNQAPVETEVGGKLVSTTGFHVWLPYDTSIDAANRLRVNGVVYEILGRAKDASESLCVKMLAVEVR